MIKSLLKSLVAITFLLPIHFSRLNLLCCIPALTPDAQTIVFSYDGNIWKVPVKGGMASRVTAMHGEEINPKISPDGKWITFSSNQFGNCNVYIRFEVRLIKHSKSSFRSDNYRMKCNPELSEEKSFPRV
jgi:hypothetical protein